MTIDRSRVFVEGTQEQAFQYIIVVQHQQQAFHLQIDFV